MSYAEPQDSSRRLTGFVMVVLLHVVLVYALINGLARRVVEVVQAPVEVKVIEELKPPVDRPPPPPSPKLATPALPFIPAPEVHIESPAPPVETIAAVSAVKAVVESPLPVQHPVVAPLRTAPVVDARRCAMPEYPPASIRAQETGLVVLQFLIGVDGTAIDSRVEKSSGFGRLDEAARRALSLCKFRPGTEAGKPVQSWARIEYLWKLDDD
jgi:protein TonB